MKRSGSDLKNKICQVQTVRKKFHFDVTFCFPLVEPSANENGLDSVYYNVYSAKLFKYKDLYFDVCI